jgi:predicted ferric reductase
MSSLLIVANIFGYIGFILLYFQVVIGTRHVFGFFTKNTVAMNKLHSWLGKYGIIAVFLHPLLSMVHRLEDVFWIFAPNFVVTTETYITLGRVAFIAFLVIWITSAIVREKLRWTSWKYIHLLAYPIVFLLFIHIQKIGTFYENYAIIQFLWMFFFLLFGFVILLRLMLWGGVFKQKLVIVQKKLIGDSILLLTVSSPFNSVPSSKMGQHFFLQSGRCKSEHPFSVIKNNGNTITFGIRKVGRFWEEMERKTVGDELFMDGPYGVFTREAQNDEPKVFISAGIGVTPFVDVVEHFGKNATYINCNRSIEEAVERDNIMTHVSVYKDIVATASPLSQDTSAIVGIITKDYVLQIVGADVVKKVPFFVCGSPGFTSVIRNILSEIGVDKKNIYYEELGF